MRSFIGVRQFAVVLSATWLGVFGSVGTSAAAPEPSGGVGVEGICEQRIFTVSRQVGNPWYTATGSAAGKYNGSSASSTLSIGLSITKSVSTTVEVGAKMSVDFAIASVEASTSFGVTKTSQSGITVTNTLVVPGRHYGYAQPKVEYRKFHTRKVQTRTNCSEITLTDYGYVNAITASPFFAECTATTQCTPRP